MNDEFKRSTRYTCLSSLLETRLALRIKQSYDQQARAYRISWEIKKNAIDRRRWNITSQERKVCNLEIEIISFVVNGSMKLNHNTEFSCILLALEGIDCHKLN